MNKRSLAYLTRIFVFLPFLLFLGCGGDCTDSTDPTCSNFDPCFEVEVASAEFEMGVSYFMTSNKHALQDTFVVSDTVLQGSRPVEFRGPDGYKSYHWKIGQDSTQFRDQNFSLIFIDVEPLLEIRLIVEKWPEKDCLSEEELRDTVTQYLSVLPRDSAIILGRYKGVLASAPQDSLEVWIADNPLFPPGSFFYTLFNLNPGCIPTHAGASGELGYDVFLQKEFEYTRGDCQGVTAWAFLDSTRRFININYQTFFPENEDSFTGVRIE